MKKMNKKGFTLVELLAVIVVTSLVLGLSGYGIINAYKRTKEKTVVLNETSILKAAQIFSTEASSDDWKIFENNEYFCTTIQRLKNFGLLKKEAKSGDYEDFSLITVKRDSSTLNVIDTTFVGNDNKELIELCDIKYFTIHYDYNVSGEVGIVPNDQMGEVCNDSICDFINIRLAKPKRKGYRFVGWNTESDGSGYTYNSGDSFVSHSASVITLYAMWIEDTYIVKYNGNDNDIEGNTSNTVCFRDKNCTLNNNMFVNEGYDFIGWNTESNGSGTTYGDGQIVNNLTSGSEITLYAQWKTKYKVIIKFNTGVGASIESTTTSDKGVVYKWKKDVNGTISRSIGKSNDYSDSFFNIPYNSEDDLPNYNNTKYMYITKDGYTVSSGSVWKCTSGECQGRTYYQDRDYHSNHFCDASSSDCTVELTVNWATLLPPIFTASDGIVSGEWHNNSYTLLISSENTINVSYEYKVGASDFIAYNSAIYPSEGIVTYIARTKNVNSYSNDEIYESKLDMTPPTIPIIDNPTNEEWTNQNFSLVLHSTDTLSGINHYEFRYADTDWVVYSNSGKEEFETTPFSKARNELVYVRACDNAGNCSAESSTYIRIDKTKPTISFQMKRDGTIIDISSNQYSLISSSIPNWINYSPTIEWIVSDSLSGMGRRTFYYNRANQTAFTNFAGSVDVTSQSNPYSYTVEHQGYRRFKYEACDLAGNCAESLVYIRIDNEAPTFIFQLRKDSSTGTEVPLSSNEYGTSSSDNIKWINYTPYLEWTTVDNLSGINRNKKDNLSYNQVGQTTFTDLYKKLSITGNSNNVFSASISSEGCRYFRFEVCDIVGNCSYSDIYLKLDKTLPTISFQMLNGSSIVSSSYYGDSASNNLTWFNFEPLLRWSASDSLSNINTSGEYYNNISGSETLSETLSSTPASVTGVMSGDKYIFNVGDIYGGYRKFKVNICDEAGNCSENIKYFRYHANSTVDRYVKSSTNCYSNTNTSSSIKASYSYGNYISGLVKSYTGVWYYNSNLNCYVDGNYLTTSSPNSSSGGDNSSYWVKLYKNCPSTHSCVWKDSGSDGRRVTYNGSMSISNFPKINISTSNYAIIGWKVGSATSTRVVQSYIDAAEHESNLYAWWKKTGQCVCSVNSDCSSDPPNTVRCENGLCIIYDSSGNAIGNTCS